MQCGRDTHGLSVHPIGLLRGSNPLRKLWSFSSCPFVSGELGDGESSARQPNCIGTAKEITHVCEHLFRGLQPMRGEGAKKRTWMAHGWSHCWKFGDQQKKRMMVWCKKVRQGLGQGLCLFPRRTEMEGVRVMPHSKIFHSCPVSAQAKLHKANCGNTNATEATGCWQDIQINFSCFVQRSSGWQEKRTPWSK